MLFVKSSTMLHERHSARPPKMRGIPSLVLLAVLSLLIAAAGLAAPASAAPLRAKSAILLDATTGRILYEQHPDLRIPPASLTKVISMYVAMNAISSTKLGYGTKVRISPLAASTGGSRLGLVAGEKVSMDKLLQGMAVASGNDASVAVAEAVAGSTGAFVGRMNALARRLGMKNTRFANVHGLPAAGQITTARDMMRLARAYQAAYPSARRYHLSPYVTHRTHTEPNHNPLVGSYPGLDGLKTGWVTAAGYNIIATATQERHKLIAVVMGAPNTGVRAAEAARLLNAGFAAVRKQAPTAAAALGVSPARAAQLRKSAPAPAPPPRIHPQDAPARNAGPSKHTMKNRKADRFQPARRPASRQPAESPRQARQRRAG
ncbi:MAG: D-alanyl-D-alanine carboxypeptidase [Mailhella sp.]|nr:D-alanyl-D-alanine carboxypeptidase [Mailhella sp.]